MPIELQKTTDLPDPMGIWQSQVMTLINEYQDELEDELGVFTVRDIPGEYEVLIVTEGGDEFRAYLSDHHADARLIVDDYIPEKHGGIPI